MPSTWNIGRDIALTLTVLEVHASVLASIRFGVLAMDVEYFTLVTLRPTTRENHGDFLDLSNISNDIGDQCDSNLLYISLSNIVTSNHGFSPRGNRKR